MTRIEHVSEPSEDRYAQVAELYDHVAPYRDRPDVPFFVEQARNAGGPVLEVGCGTGRVLIPCARAGVEIVGLDLSVRMLEICRMRLEDESDAVRSRVQLVHGDMRDFELGRTFAMAMLPFRSFQHVITADDQVTSLRCIRAHLEPGGRLLLDVFNPSLDMLANRVIGKEYSESEFTMPDGRRVVRSYKVAAHDRFRQVNDVELIYDVTHEDGREERVVDAFEMRYLFRFEAEHLLARCGFELVRVYSGYDGSDYGSEYPGELVMLASRAD
jgi:SAM-dependent methyltransferase